MLHKEEHIDLSLKKFNLLTITNDEYSVYELHDLLIQSLHLGLNELEKGLVSLSNLWDR